MFELEVVTVFVVVILAAAAMLTAMMNIAVINVVIRGNRLGNRSPVSSSEPPCGTAAEQCATAAAPLEAFPKSQFRVRRRHCPENKQAVRLCTALS